MKGEKRNFLVRAILLPNSNGDYFKTILFRCAFKYLKKVIFQKMMKTRQCLVCMDVEKQMILKLLVCINSKNYDCDLCFLLRKNAGKLENAINI